MLYSNKSISSAGKCTPCNRKTPILKRKEALLLLKGLKDWELSKNSKQIFTEYLMKDFVAAVRLINAIATIAEKEGHHPDLQLFSYRRLKIELTTHAVRGLTKNDLILASRIEALPKALKRK